MHFIRFWFVCAAVWLTLPLFAQKNMPQQFSPAAAVADLGFSAERLARLDTLLEGYVRRGVLPCATTFIARRGQIVHHKAFGYSQPTRQTAARTDDVYRIMSQTKLITTIGALILMEEGKFYLDQPISDFLPQFAHMRVLVSADAANPSKHKTRPAKRPITFRHLMSHTAGIPYEMAIDKLPQYKIPFLATTDNMNLAQLIDRVAKRPLVADPGDQYVYGLNTDILGRLIEVMSGQDLQTFLRTRVCGPLGMADTWFYLPEALVPRLVELHSQTQYGKPFTVHANADFRVYPMSGAKTLYWGGSGMSSTVRDYAQICQFILQKGEWNGVRLLSPSTVALLATNQIGNNFVWDRQDKFSLGLQIFSPESHYRDNATPGTLMWGGYFSTEYTIDPEKELVALIFMNVQPFAQGGELQHKFRTMVYAALME